MFNIFKPSIETAVIFISEKLVINGYISNWEEKNAFINIFIDEMQPKPWFEIINKCSKKTFLYQKD